MKQACIQITENVGWAKRFWNGLVPAKERIVAHPFFEDLQAGKLPLKKLRRGLVEFFPLIENFPKFMGLNLAKTEPALVRGHDQVRAWLLENMHVEEKHAQWWRSWANGFQCTDESLDNVRPKPAIDALTHYLWSVNTRRSLIEGIAATNLAIEWPTGEWAIKVLNGIRVYQKRGDATPGGNALKWLKAHAEYDDHHPYEAMELIKVCARNSADRTNAFLAAQRAMEFYLMALEDCYQ